LHPPAGHFHEHIFQGRLRDVEVQQSVALRFEKAFGVDMDTLMRMQNSYDIAQTRSRAKEINVERYEPRPAA